MTTLPQPRDFTARISDRVATDAQRVLAEKTAVSEE